MPPLKRSVSESPDLDYLSEDAKSEFIKGSQQWQEALARAQSLPPGHFPKAAFDLSSLLLHIPAFPDRIPSHITIIRGYSTWLNSGSINGVDDGTAQCSLREKQENTQEIHLRASHPLYMTLSASEDFRVWEGTLNNGVVLLVLGCAYMFNARLAESQSYNLEHADMSLGELLHHDPTSSVLSEQIDLSYAGEEELSWWKAVTKPGWGFGIDGQCLPWTIRHDELGGLLAHANKDASVDNNRLPTSSQASIWIGRLCHAFNLENQYIAALSAAISLPSQRSFRPGLSRISLPRPSFSAATAQPIPSMSYPSGFNALRYFMTLSLSKTVYTACLESVLWTPNVSCDKAGAVLGPIRNTLAPILKSKNYELLAKVLCCKKSAPLWLGTALCGKPHGTSITLEYGDWFGQRTSDAAPWTGLQHSFLNLSPPGPFLQGDRISRADVWRLRHDCHMLYERDEDYSSQPPNGWEPFGAMQKQDVDLELHGHLLCSHNWRYSHWTWLIGQQACRGQGYAETELANSAIWNNSTTDTGKASSHHFKAASAPLKLTEEECIIIQKLSKKATQQTFSWCPNQIEKGFTAVLGQKYTPNDCAKESKESGRSFSDQEVLDWLETTRKLIRNK